MAADPRRWWALAATATTVLVIGLDTTILNVALPDIGVSLHATSAQLQWFADAYLLVLGGAAAAGRDARRPVSDGSARPWSAWSSSSSARCGARSRPARRASSPPGRCSGSAPRCSSPWRCRRWSCSSSAEERTRAIAMLGISTMVGLPLGPIVAGVLLQHFWWGSVFVLNLPVIALALVAVLLFLPGDGRSARPPAGHRRHPPHLGRDARGDLRRDRGAGARLDRPAGADRTGRRRGAVRRLRLVAAAGPRGRAGRRPGCCGGVRPSGGGR